MRRHVFPACVLATLVVLSASTASAEEFGTLTGVVTDSAFGKPVVCTQIRLEGTNFGTIVNDGGFYRIRNIPPGEYIVVFQCIGYDSNRIEHVQIAGNEEIIQNAILAERDIEVAVDFPRRVHPPSLSSGISAHRMIPYWLPLRGYIDGVGSVPGGNQLPGGVITNTGFMSIRDASPTDNGYFIGGVRRQDPATGLPTTYIGAEPAETSYNLFDASFGHTTSGIMKATPYGPLRILSGRAEAITDNFHGESYDFNRYSLSLSGPLIFGTRELNFRASVDRGWFGDAAPRAAAGGMLPHNSSGIWNWQGLLRWRPASSCEWQAGLMGSDLDAKTFSQEWYLNPDHAPRVTQKSQSYWFSWKRDYWCNSFFKLMGQWFTTESKTGDGEYFDNIWAYGRPDGNPSVDETGLFYSANNPETPPGRNHEIHIDPIRGYGYITIIDTLGSIREIVVRDEYGHVRDGRYREDVDTAYASGANPWDSDLIVRNESGAIYADESHVYDDYQHQKTSSIFLSADLTHQLCSNHLLSAGMELQRHTLRYYHHYYPQFVYRDSVVNGQWFQQGGFSDVDHYGYDAFGNESDTLSEGMEARRPLSLSLYLQDKLTLDDLTASFGMRFDSYNPNHRCLRFPDTPWGDPDDMIGDDRLLDPTDFDNASAKNYISPRLKIAFQPYGRTVIRFGYGSFVQRPRLQELYSSWDFMSRYLDLGRYDLQLGNPDLKPEKARIWELSWSQWLYADVIERVGFEITGFYKTITDRVRFIRNSPAFGRAEWFTYGNDGETRARGIETQFTFRKRGVFGDSSLLTGEINYTLLDADGDLTTYYKPSWTTTGESHSYVPLPLDRRHTLMAVLDYRALDGNGPRVAGIRPLSNLDVQLVVLAGSGFPYSPLASYNEAALTAYPGIPAGPIYSERTPSVFRLDLKIGKTLRSITPEFEVFVEIINLLDRENVIDVWQSSGQPDNIGWLETEAGRAFVENYSTPDWTGLTGEEKYNLRQNDPLNYDTPRQIRLGLRLHF